MLKIRGLSYRYRGAEAHALDNVSISVTRGRILGLLGPNGAGKSTLADHLAGLIKAQHGTIELDDLSITEARRRDPTRIAVAPQNFAFYPVLTVTENLACFVAANRLRGASARSAIERCLAFTELEAHADTRAEHLSGGFRRRLNLAIALLAEPELLVLDEPTVGVDPRSRALLLNAVKGLATSGTALIYTSHYMEEIEAIADDVAILHHGRLLRHNTLKNLLSEGGAHLQITLVELPPADLVQRLAGYGRVRAKGLHLTVELFSGISPAAPLAAVDKSGANIRETRFGQYSLDQLFRRLTEYS
jgi:ABC-2 type transport system ATP-binding protein